MIRQKRPKRYRGIFLKTKQGATFFQPEDKSEDFYIPRSKVNSAQHGDEVLVQQLATHRHHPKGGLREGRVVKVLSRANTRIVGKVIYRKEGIAVVPDDPRLTEWIYLPDAKRQDVRPEEQVVVQMTKFSKKGKDQGRIVRRLGQAGSKDAVFLSTLEEFQIPYVWPREVKEASKRLPKSVLEDEKRGRTDFRDQLAITIDGSDTKDVDDAIFLTKTQNGYVLYVHIADVAHYVKEGDPIDQEARLRATSVYLIDNVVAMLPKKLSNGICSLNEGVDRLCMTCVMTLDESGHIKSAKVVEGLLCVKHHMTYEEVQAILEGDEKLRKQYADVVEMIEEMSKLSQKMDVLRRERGNVDFASAEPVFTLGEDGVPTSVQKRQDLASMRLIENFMISANVSVSTLFHEQEVPFLYRVHEEPDAERMWEMRDILERVGLSLPKKSDIRIKDLQRLLEQTEGTPQETFVHQSVLRAMMRARYDEQPLGHFALAEDYYSHFTSPIRRYPDLQIHRIIKEVLTGRLRIGHYRRILPDVAKHASHMQQRADECERAYDKIKQVAFMKRHIGQTYEGTIVHISNNGAYIALDNTIEGMVRFRDIAWDDFEPTEVQDGFVGRHTREVYRIGQRVMVKVDAVSEGMRTIDFSLCRGGRDGAHHRNQS